MFNRVRSGQFDRVATIEEDVPDSLDTHNNPVSDWVVFAANVPCSVIPVKGGEQLQAEMVTAVSDKHLVMRWIKNVTEKMRVIFEDEYYDILLIQEMGRRRGLKLTIRKKDNAQH